MGDSEHPLSPPKLITEERNSRPRSTSVQSRRSWPLLPALEVTGSSHSNIFHPVRSPIIDQDETPSTPTSTDSESSISSEFGVSDKEKDLGYDVVHQDVNNIDQEDTRRSSHGARRDSAGTLVEAALDQAEARDRHVRFQDHIAEAGSLVERMLSTSTRRPSSNTHRPSTTIDECNEFDLGSLERQQSHQSPIPASATNTINPPAGGSVLASLMKLESQRRQPSIKRKKTIKRKKVNKMFIVIVLKTEGGNYYIN